MVDTLLFNEDGLDWYLNRKSGQVYALDSDTNTVYSWHIANPPSDPTEALHFTSVMDRAVKLGHLRRLNVYAVV